MNDIGRCDMCLEENVEVRHINLYTRGSEGTTVCHSCEMSLVDFVRSKTSQSRMAKMKVEYVEKPEWTTMSWGQVISISRGRTMGVAHVNVSGSSDFGVPPKEAREVARFIVTACNGHYEILEAFRELLDVCHCTNDCPPDDMSCASNRARFVLEKYGVKL